MSHTPGSSPYAQSGPYTQPGHSPSPPRRNLPLIGAAIVACTALVLGAVLLAAYMSGRESTPDPTAASDESDVAIEAGESESESDSAAPADGEGDPEQIAVAVAEIMYGLNDDSADQYLCSDPGYYLTDLEATGEAVAETLGELSDLIDDIVASDSYTEGAATMVVVSMVIYGSETEMGIVELIVEDGSWVACDFSYN